jgi:hypothetical protein
MKSKTTPLISFVLSLVMLCGMAAMPARAATTTDGWLSDLDGNLLTDSDGYYVLTITPAMITGDTVNLNFNRYTRLFLNSFQNESNADATFKMKIVNNSGKRLTYSDYSFTTENMLPRTSNLFAEQAGVLTESERFSRAFGSAYTSMLPTITSPYIRTDMCLDVKGFDGKNINLMIAPLRCVNDALIDFYGAEETFDITLPQMMNRDANIKAAGYTGYADYLRKYYNVQSLYDLPPETAYNILGTTRNAQTGITNWKDNSTTGKPIPASELTLLTNEFKIWGMVCLNQDESTKENYPYRPNYHMMETDSEVIQFAYDFLYAQGLRFSFDQQLRPFDTTDSEAGRGGDFGIKAYINKTPGATAHINSVFSGTMLNQGQSFTLDHVMAGLYVPNAWNQYRIYDYSFRLVYTISDEKGDDDERTTTKPGKLPDTSDGMPVYLVALAAVFLFAALAVQLILYKRKKT